MSTLAGSAERVVRPTRGGIQTSTMIMGLLTVFVAVMTVTPVAVALVASFRTAPVGQPGVWTVSGIVNVAPTRRHFASCGRPCGWACCEPASQL